MSPPVVYNISFNHPESSSGGIEGDHMLFTLGDHLCRCNLVLSTGLKVLIGHRKEIWKLTFRALALRRSESRNCGCVWFIYLTNRLHVAVHLLSNRSQMTSKCGTRGVAECLTMFLSHFDVFCDLLLNQTNGNMESICFEK